MQRLKKGGGGGHTYGELVRRAPHQLSVRIQLGGGLGACSPRKILKFRLCESVSEAVGDHHNHAKFVATGV